MKPEHLKIFQALNETELLGILIIGEAEGEPIEGWIAVGSVVRNRVFYRKWDGETYHQVILMPKQFSCFDDVNVNRMLKILDKPAESGIWWRQAKWVAQGIIAQNIRDNTSEALNYHSFMVSPPWDKKMVKTIQIGNHIFYKDK